MPARIRPLLFLDVDGTLIPFGGHQPESSGSPPGANPLLGRLNPLHGGQLSALQCDLVWATTWMSEANEVIAPLLGLPSLPVVDWPDEDDEGPLHWKTAPLVAWAAGRPFVWLDDEIAAVDRTWVAARHPGPALLHRVAADRGLTAHDFVLVADWVDQLQGRGMLRA